MERASIIAILKSRVVIPQPGKYLVRVTSVNPHVNANGNAVNIVNFAAMSAVKAATLQKKVTSGTVTQDDLNDGALSFSTLQGKACPEKGAFVYIYTDMVPNREKTGLVLAVKGWEPVAVSEPVSFNWDTAVEEESSNIDDVFNG